MYHHVAPCEVESMNALLRGQCAHILSTWAVGIPATADPNHLKLYVYDDIHTAAEAAAPAAAPAAALVAAPAVNK